ncbi:MAG: hypothetical protein HC824_19675 [Synechococcales cyanobacterium RM1_1_8]|nr:hypothetical protein [Synechococcales cyanobacterium RM1_1_8]
MGFCPSPCPASWPMASIAGRSACGKR